MLTDFLDFLMDLMEKAEGTVFEPFIPYIFWIIIISAVFKFIILPIAKGLKKLIGYISRHQFIKNKIYVNLSFMESADVYYAINQFIPTRFSSIKDPGNDDEPVPIYVDSTYEREPLLIERFIKYEFDIKGGKKYYLCLADCGMGKTTFLINLYYRILKQGKWSCRFIGLQNPSCLEEIDEIAEKGKTILLLDALDENDSALVNYNAFIEKLEQKTRGFYRVVITSRTNFFESESKERLADHRTTGGTTSKLPKLQKFYITPFTDEDMKRFLFLRYRFQRNKRKQAWGIISQNKNLSVRPLLLRFMDELLAEEQVFEYDFQLYECLFRKWIDRETQGAGNDSGEALYHECQQVAKAIYYQWMKSGRIGIYLSELPENTIVLGLEALRLKGHAILNRTSDGLYKFSHKSYWEYMLAKLALSDMHFAGDLYIKNFDRATSFLEEMIQYDQAHPEEQTPESGIGIAIYLMKYKRPEDAARLCRAIAPKCMTHDLQLQAMILQAQCLQRQMKYLSEECALKDCRTLIDMIPLTEETVPLYTRFGAVLSKSCERNHLKSGQEFLRRIIEYCTEFGLNNYSLLKCYESYCSCCINYCLKEQALNQMRLLIREYFQNDQYALYLEHLAASWKINCSNKETYETLRNIAETDQRFMDFFEQIQLNCDLGIANAAINAKKLELWNTMVLEQLNNGWDISHSIYVEDENVDEQNDPYSIYVCTRFLLACHVFGVSDNGVNLMEEIGQKIMNTIIQYMKQSNLQQEMWRVRLQLLDYIRGDNVTSFPLEERAAYAQLELVEENGNNCDLINVYWNLFVLYDSQGNDRELGQRYLMKAYALAKQSEDYYMTANYCDLLQAVLSFYQGDFDKAAIARELIDITSKIYGSDSNRSRIYLELWKYFADENDACEMKACLELLRCSFTVKELDRYYKSCIKYQATKLFLDNLDLLCLEKGMLSKEDAGTLKDFIDGARSRMEPHTIQALEVLLKRKNSF